MIPLFKSQVRMGVVGGEGGRSFPRDHEHYPQVVLVKALTLITIRLRALTLLFRSVGLTTS